MKLLRLDNRADFLAFFNAHPDFIHGHSSADTYSSHWPPSDSGCCACCSAIVC